MSPVLSIGLIVNPYAGVGGSVALKGSDGEAVLREALARGARPQAGDRTLMALSALYSAEVGSQSGLEWFTWAGAMGQEALAAAGCPSDRVHVLGSPGQPVTASDTVQAAQAMKRQGVDLLLFAGGDGTARDICSVVGTSLPVLGIPAGCKMHSGVYAINPQAAGQLLGQLCRGELVHYSKADVRDIDEDAFRAGEVRARYFGSMQVPSEDRFLQQVKCGGREVEDLVINEIAAWMVESMEPGLVYAMGSGTTVAAVMEQLGLENTLLGVDIVCDGEVVAADVTSQQLQEQALQQQLEAVITVIGGQGHLFGRGNQQFSPSVIRAIGREHFHVLASRTKLKTLAGRPVVVDTGDAALDQELAGLLPVITGYDDNVLYQVGSGPKP